MNELIERLRGLHVRIRRNPAASPGMHALALVDMIDALEQIERRLAVIEQLHQRRSAEQRDWAVNSKVPG